MNPSTALEKLLSICNTVLENRGGTPLTEIKPSFDLRSDIGFDSLDLAELTVRIEATFGVDVFQDGLVNTIEDILHKIQAGDDK